MRKREHPNRIRNGRIRRDMKQLLSYLAHAKDAGNDALEDYEVFSAAEAIAKRHALYFDDEGAVREERGGR